MDLILDRKQGKIKMTADTSAGWGRTLRMLALNRTGDQSRASTYGNHVDFYSFHRRHKMFWMYITVTPCTSFCREKNSVLNAFSFWSLSTLNPECPCFPQYIRSIRIVLVFTMLFSLGKWSMPRLNLGPEEQVAIFPPCQHVLCCSTGKWGTEGYHSLWQLATEYLCKGEATLQLGQSLPWPLASGRAGIWSTAS
jgi:hypothetical protein